MIATANAQASADASFICADAQTYAFTPASYDVLMSRFGVMFFEDPVSAFRNLRTAATSQAELRLAAWRDPAENPFMTVAEQAAAPFLPQRQHAPPARPDSSGLPTASAYRPYWNKADGSTSRYVPSICC